MIKLENIEVIGFKHAIRGMRNPKNSWSNSDSSFNNYFGDADGFVFTNFGNDCINIGENDLTLMKNLAKAGTDHRKFMRMITVYVDITAPLYWWKEFDTYKVGTVANSCSTMHKIADKEFGLSDFSHEHLLNGDGSRAIKISPSSSNISLQPLDILLYTIGILNACRLTYLETKDKQYWWQMIQLLPSSYNQKRTVMLNYEVLANMYHARKNHKLDEWIEFCKEIEKLPYFKEICL